MKDRIYEYVLGILSAEERVEFERAMAHDPALRAEVLAEQEMTETLALENQVAPPSSLKGKLFDKIDEIDSAQDNTPPLLNPGSVAADYRFWLDQEGMAPPEQYDHLHFIPIAETEDGLSAIVWIKDFVPEEVHNDCIERFLVLEGSCEISFAGQTYSLKAGDYLSVPLHHPHTVQVTSEIVCKLIVQRHAA